MATMRWGILALLALAVALVLVLLLWSDSAARSNRITAADTSIPAGYDLFETDPAQTVFRFMDKTQIPANFFAPGSKPFTGDVEFGGIPIGTFHTKYAGDADTVVQRKAAASVPGNGTPSSPVPIELVQLSLVSMAPIAVSVGSGTQLWDVHAALSSSRPSTGAMVIAKTAANGGLFQSQLQVYPKFTFTRLSDGAMKVLDVGALPDGQRPDDPLQTNNGAVWRLGCIPPALDTGLGPKFCPGQSPKGLKTLTIEQSQYARHGVWPVQPGLEHFDCYVVTTSNRTPKAVKLSDQFGARDAKVLRGGGGDVCAPSRKNKERRVVNKHDHLRCFPTNKGKPTNRIALLRNQFGAFSVTVLEPQGLCAPSTKQVFQGNKPPNPPRQSFTIDHYQCYATKPFGKYKSVGVHLSDQFGQFDVKVAQPFRLCAPVGKNGAKIQHRVQHLVCYKVKPTPAVTRQLSVHNQFGGEVFKRIQLRTLCVPTLKVLLPKG
jgi:hypothetical protein